MQKNLGKKKKKESAQKAKEGIGGEWPQRCNCAAAGGVTGERPGEKKSEEKRKKSICHTFLPTRGEKGKKKGEKRYGGKKKSEPAVRKHWRSYLRMRGKIKLKQNWRENGLHA